MIRGRELEWPAEGQKLVRITCPCGVPRHIDPEAANG